MRARMRKTEFGTHARTPTRTKVQDAIAMYAEERRSSGLL